MTAPTTSQKITRRSASNLALAFILLPRDKRHAMAALYAFCREVDDAADNDEIPAEKRSELLDHWRDDIAAAWAGGAPELEVNRELQQFIPKYHLPLEHFHALIEGMRMDLTLTRYETMAELEVYCHRAASVVGLLSIEIFGYRNAACRDYAVHLGKALQLTNILRDVEADAARGRIYLPLELLRKFGVTETSILHGDYSPNYGRLAAQVALHARRHYERARELLPREDRRAMIAAELMGAVYWRLLLKLERESFNVFNAEPVRIGKPRKIWLILRTAIREGAGFPGVNYGG